MRRFFPLVVMIMMIMAACSPVVVTETAAKPASPTETTPLRISTTTPDLIKTLATPEPEETEKDRSPVFIQTAKILAGDEKGSAALYITGDLPTPCHKLDYQMNKPDSKNRVDVEVYSIEETGKMCAQVLSHFEQTIQLTDLSDGSYSLYLNDKKVSDFQVPLP